MTPELEKDLLELLAECNSEAIHFSEYDKAKSVEKLADEIIKKHNIILP